jgi:hypothetical protein
MRHVPALRSMCARICALLLVVGACTATTPKEQRGAPPGPSAPPTSQSQVDLPPSTSGLPLDGIPIKVTRTEVLVGDDEKPVASLSALGAGFEVAALTQELAARFPNYQVGPAPTAHLYVDRYTTFDQLVRIYFSVGKVCTVRFAGRGKERVEELFPSVNMIEDPQLFVGVTTAGGFVSHDVRYCHGELPPPNMAFPLGPGAGEDVRKALELKGSYSAMIHAKPETTFGEIAAVMDALSHVAHFSSIAFCR